MSQPAPFRLGYRPALDGIRALAITLVVILHTFTFLGHYGAHQPWHPFEAGSRGVDIFFVLSGFLITSLLLQEWRERGRISFLRFYARRALRLWPALWVTLAILLVYLAVVGPPGTHGLGHGLIETVAYINNFFVSHNTFLTQWFGQSWSLAIEEQFYIVWPALLLGLLFICRSPRVLACVVAAGTVVFALWRVELIRHYHLLWTSVYYRTDAHVDELMIGALLAILLHFGLVHVKPRPWLGLAAFAACLVLAQTWWSYDPGYFYFGAPLTMVAGFFLILGVLDGTGPIAELFSRPVVRWVGRVSYTLYLVHVPVFQAVAVHFAGRPGHAVTLEKMFIGNVVAFAITAAIHYGIELRANRVKNRLSQVEKPKEAVVAAV